MLVRIRNTEFKDRFRWYIHPFHYRSMGTPCVHMRQRIFTSPDEKGLCDWIFLVVGLKNQRQGSYTFASLSNITSVLISSLHFHQRDQRGWAASSSWSRLSFKFIVPSHPLHQLIGSTQTPKKEAEEKQLPPRTWIEFPVYVPSIF